MLHLNGTGVVGWYCQPTEFRLALKEQFVCVC